MSDFNQDEIDALLAGLGTDGAGGGDEPAAEPEMELEGVASQDDIDALFAAVGSDAPDDAPAAAEAPAAEAPPPAPEPAAIMEEEGAASQDDIDALFAAVGGDAPDAAPAAAEAPAPEAPPPAPEPAAAMEEEGVANQDDIDALFANAGGDAVAPAAEPEPVAEAPAAAPEPEPEPEPEAAPQPLAAGAADDSGSMDSADIEALLSGIKADAPANVGVGGGTVAIDTVDMNELLNQINEAAPPPAQMPAHDTQSADTITEVPDPAAMFGLPQAEIPAPQMPFLQPQPMAYSVPSTPAPPLELPPAASHMRDVRSVLSSAGEVESMANQISGMLGQLSEKAHRYMQAWLTADSESKDLRTRLLNEEHLRAVAIGEKDAMVKEVEHLRSKVSTLEGEKLGTDEARRTSEAALQSQIRELESRIKILSSETESLKDELTRSRTEATGVDIESRRARFEADRLKSEIESERMERLRIQRALENREKEIQAMQAQSAGQASSLFIDELHRLVRRLESELDARASGAHEALRQVDRLEVPESMVPVMANLRASLMQALGADKEQNDAIRSLGREAERVGGIKGVEPVKTEMVSFESALSTYNLVSALEIAGALLREAKATPVSLMRRIYQSPALRRQEASEHLSDLARLLEGLRTVQESADRARGSESGDSEVFFVQMFDFLHNLVRMKLVTRMTGDMWRIFLDLRGRFSFVTSDKQWADYRDGVLGTKNDS